MPPDPERVIVGLLGDLSRQGAVIETATGHLQHRVTMLESRLASLHERRASAEWWAFVGAVGGFLGGLVASLIIHGVWG